MSKMCLHDPFEHLKHKLWSKEGSGIKLPIWLLTTKSRESPRFSHVQVACDILLENLLTKATTLLQTSFQLKVCMQSYETPKLQESQLWQFWDSWMGVLKQNVIWMCASWQGTKYTIRGEGVGFPQVRAMVNLMSLKLPMARPSTKRVPTMH